MTANPLLNQVMFAQLNGLGRFTEAREQALHSKLLAKTNGYRNLEVNNDAQLAEVARAEGRIDEAVRALRAGPIRRAPTRVDRGGR